MYGCTSDLWPNKSSTDGCSGALHYGLLVYVLHCDFRNLIENVCFHLRVYVRSLQRQVTTVVCYS